MTHRLRLSLDAWRHIIRQLDANRARLSWRARTAFWVSASVHSLLLRIQHEGHKNALNSVDLQPPIFLLGFWRSGTTLLHELFSCDRRLGFPSTYACLNPFHFLLTEQWIKRRSSQEDNRRPMDNMLYSWTSPQEDEFALLSLGAPSVYEALLIPSLMRHPSRLLDFRLRPIEEQSRWTEVFCYFMRLLTAQQNKRMVMKSPPHGFKLSLLTSLFPNAQYVIIERNPYEVFASNLKLWWTLLDLYSLESVSSEEIENFVLEAYVLHEKAIAEGCRHIDSRSIERVRYEELVADPLGQIARIYDRLQLGGGESVQAGVEEYLLAHAGHRRNTFLLSAAQKERVDATWGGIITKKGYDWPSAHIALAS